MTNTIQDLLFDLLGRREQENRPDWHKHRCRLCGCVWAHDKNCADSEKAHTCPECHQVLPIPWSWYEGPLAAVVRTCANAAIRPFRKVA